MRASKRKNEVFLTPGTVPESKKTVSPAKDTTTQRLKKSYFLYGVLDKGILDHHREAEDSFYSLNPCRSTGIICF